MKKLLSCLTALCLSASMAAPMVSNAIYHEENSESKFIEQLKDKEKYVEIDNKYKELFYVSVFTNSFPIAVEDEVLENTVFYSKLNGQIVYALVPKKPSFLSEVSALFNLTEGTTAEQVNELLTKEFGYEINIEKDFKSNYDYRTIGSKKYFKKVSDLLKNAGYVDSFVIPGEYFQIIEFGSYVAPMAYVISDEKLKEVEDYVNENELGQLNFVEKYFNSYSIYTLDSDKENTLAEKLDISLKLCKETGITMNYEIPETAKAEVGTGDIDVFNSMDGDANNDSTTTIADAAAVFQSLANPDKYKLSAQGEFNADFACDGITVDDAVRIQKKLAGITE